MKYTILINQVGIVEAGLHKYTDVVDWMIIDYLKDWFFAENKKTILNSEDGKQYTWVNYNHLMESMPLLKITSKNALTDRFKKLRKLGLIKTITFKDNSLYFILTEKCIQTCFYQETGSRHTLDSIENTGSDSNLDSKTIENTDLSSDNSDLSDRDRTGYPTVLGQGVSNRTWTAQIEYQSNSINNNIYNRSRTPKKLFLDHVLLTEEEYEKLKERLGEDKVSEYIESLNNYIAQIGLKRAQAKYKSHYHVILNWHRMDEARVKRAVAIREALKAKEW